MTLNRRRVRQRKSNPYYHNRERSREHNNEKDSEHNPQNHSSDFSDHKKDTPSNLTEISTGCHANEGCETTTINDHSMKNRQVISHSHCFAF